LTRTGFLNLMDDDEHSSFLCAVVDCGLWCRIS
jgi:hypothetical protein